MLHHQNLWNVIWTQALLLSYCVQLSWVRWQAPVFSVVRVVISTSHGRFRLAFLASMGDTKILQGTESYGFIEGLILGQMGSWVCTVAGQFLSERGKHVIDPNVHNYLTSTRCLENHFLCSCEDQGLQYQIRNQNASSLPRAKSREQTRAGVCLILWAVLVCVLNLDTTHSKERRVKATQPHWWEKCYCGGGVSNLF